jgi:hypothetical protein
VREDGHPLGLRSVKFGIFIFIFVNFQVHGYIHRSAEIAAVVFDWEVLQKGIVHVFHGLILLGMIGIRSLIAAGGEPCFSTISRTLFPPKSRKG